MRPWTVEGPLFRGSQRSLKPGEHFEGEKLIRIIYDSHGLNPEIVKEFQHGPCRTPDNFYMLVGKRHEQPTSEETIKKEEYPLDMPETKLTYYEDPDKFDFEAKVIAVIKDGVILDHTLFLS